jgi:hypothetical protein
LLVELNDPSFRFGYPESWVAEPVRLKQADVSDVHVRLTAGSNVRAALFVRARRYRAAPPAIETLENELGELAAESGAKLTALPKQLASAEDPRAQAVQGWLGTYSADARLDNAEMTARLSLVRRGKITFSLLLVAPTLSEDILVALRAQRALEIVRASLDVTR